jgi:hypothetical protein
MAWEQSAVTVVGVDAPHSVICTPDGDDAEGAERILRTIAASVANAGSNNTYGGRATSLVVLNPNHARMIAKWGYSREDVQRRLHELAVNTKGQLNQYAGMRQHSKEVEHEIVHAISTPEHVVVAVAGGEGIYSAVFNCWGGGGHGVIPITQEIEIGQACELPMPAGAVEAVGAANG